MEITLIDFPL